MEPNGFQNVDYQNEKETQQGFNSCTSSVTLAQVQMTSQMTSQCPQNLELQLVRPKKSEAAWRETSIGTT